MKRWWVIPALAGLVAAAGFANWGYRADQDKKMMLNYLNNRNQRAYYELVDNVQNVEAMLSKGIVSNTPGQRMIIFANIWQRAYQAQNNLSQLPMSWSGLTRTSKFLTQTGDFSWSLARKYARGGTLKQDELTKLNRLHTEAGYLSAELLKVGNATAGRTLTWGALGDATDNKLKNQKAPTLVGLEKLEKNMQEFPTLIYDGPFSDHILTKKPEGLTGPSINRAQAARTAIRFAEAGSKARYRVTRTDDVKGTIPAFRLYLIPGNAASPVVITDVSKKGGHILSEINTRPVNTARINRDRAVAIANDFLARRGINSMEATYVLEQRNTAVIIFEYKQDGVIIYPDQMKVKVALDNGEVVGFEGTGFVMHHRARKLAKPKISEKKALAAVNPQLKIKSKRLAVIPIDGLKEVLAYEFKGDFNGDSFIVYINAQTGAEESILKVVDDGSGPVTM